MTRFNAILRIFDFGGDVYRKNHYSNNNKGIEKKESSKLITA